MLVSVAGSPRSVKCDFCRPRRQLCLTPMFRQRAEFSVEQMLHWQQTMIDIHTVRRCNFRLLPISMAAKEYVPPPWSLTVLGIC